MKHFANNTRPCVVLQVEVSLVGQRVTERESSEAVSPLQVGINEFPVMFVHLFSFCSEHPQVREIEK